MRRGSGPARALGGSCRSRVGLGLARNGDLVMSWLPETDRRLAAVPQRAVLLGGVAAMDVGYFGIQDGEDMPLWSMVVVENTEDEYEITAGKKGLEALVLEFPLDIE